MTSVIQFRKHFQHGRAPWSVASERGAQSAVEAAERALEERDELTRQAAQEARERLERAPDNDRGR